MLTLKIAGSAINQIPMDWSGNKERLLTAIEEAKTQKATVLCLPELCITGYGCEDAFFNPHVQEKALDMLFAILPKTQGLAVSLGLPLRHRGALFNCTAMIADGKLLGFVAKKSLAGDGVHYEPRWFKAWEPEIAEMIGVRGHKYPFGDLHFNLSGIRIGFEICEEAWVAHRPGTSLAQRAVDIILNPSASHFAFGKLDIRKRFVCEGSRAFNVAYVYSNLLGNEAGRIVYDGGVLIASNGELLCAGPRFSYKDVLVTSCTVDLDRNRVVRSRTSSYRPDLAQVPHLCIDADLDWNPAKPELPATTQELWESSEGRKEEEFTRAVSLGLFDFMRKSQQNGFVISLSGGVDSAAVTLLCRCAFEFAAKELGFEGLKSKLKNIRAASNCKNVDELCHQLITTAYQATKNSSTQTRNAARDVALDANATYFDWSVDQVLQDYHSLAEGTLNEKLTWEKHDITLQNIQARARGPAIWMIANLRGALLLATSNRSESAVGYATMDGDTCGGISPIGGIDKAFLRSWAKWLCNHGPQGLRAFPSFNSVLAKAPTAELRPQDRHQTDEEDLMPYEILDQIEKLAIRDKNSPLDCLRALTVANAEVPVPQLKSWTAKFFRLWCRNQWKRERYAPAFHLDDESLDPKTWCRFPILSSGLEEEIAEMEKAVL